MYSYNAGIFVILYISRPLPMCEHLLAKAPSFLLTHGRNAGVGGCRVRVCIGNRVGDSAKEAQKPLLLTTDRALRLSSRIEDQVRDHVRLRYEGNVACFHLYRLCAHALCHEAFEIRIDGPVFG